MSSFSKADKLKRRLHKERVQLSSRRHLGSLEKKQDYIRRAKHHHAKRDALKSLHKKAQLRNPDEFYFSMINSEMKNGVHNEKESEETCSHEQEVLMKTQDMNYINMKRGAEIKKIERLKGELHLISIDKAPLNKHTFFVDSKKQAKNFDVSKRLNTHPQLISRSFNIPDREMLKKRKFYESEEIHNKKRNPTSAKYRELCDRINREHQLDIVARKLQVQKQLITDKETPHKKMKGETKESAAVYKWISERKK